MIKSALNLISSVCIVAFGAYFLLFKQGEVYSRDVVVMLLLMFSNLSMKLDQICRCEEKEENEDEEDQTTDE